MQRTHCSPMRIDFYDSLLTLRIFHSIVHLFPWSNILDADMGLSDSFRVPDPKTGQMRRLISQISPKEEEMFKNMLRRLNTIIKVRYSVRHSDFRIFGNKKKWFGFGGKY